MRALDASINLYGVHYTVAIEDPKAQLGMRPVILTQGRNSRPYCRRVDYCQYQHIFANGTNVWTTMSAWEPRGLSGNCLRKVAGHRLP